MLPPPANPRKTRARSPAGGSNRGNVAKVVVQQKRWQNVRGALYWPSFCVWSLSGALAMSAMNSLTSCARSPCTFASNAGNASL
jgi:hypothetical protein